MGGNTSTQGNVYLDGAPVCDYSWSWKDAQVACRSLGYNYTKKIVGNSHFGPVPDNIINGIGYLSCRGEENSLQNCSFNENVKCPSIRGAGVYCTNESSGGSAFLPLILYYKCYIVQ